MLDRLTKRERFLALLAVPVLLMAVGMGAFFWFYGSYRANQQRISGLQKQIGDEELKLARLKQAKQRLHDYETRSLSTDINLAKTQYRAFLTELGEEKMQLTGFTPKPLPTVSRRYRNQYSVYDQISYKLRYQATLSQLLTFLQRFHATNKMHRISSLSIRPTGEADGERRSEFDVSMRIDAIAVDSAPEKQPAIESPADDADNDAIAKIRYRNIFGGPNSAPQITTKTTQEFELGDVIRFKINTDEENDDQTLTYSLQNVSDELQAAEAKIIEGSSNRSISFAAGKLPEGRYEFELSVRDDGCPALEATKKFVVRVEKPRERATTKPPMEKPKFQHAKATYVTALLQDAQGQSVVWLDPRTLKDTDTFKLSVGQQFELDEITWTVKAIDIESDKVTIARDDINHDFSIGDTLYVPPAKETP